MNSVIIVPDLFGVRSYSERAAAEREQSPSLLDIKETTAGPVSAVSGVWTQRQTGECVKSKERTLSFDTRLIVALGNAL